MESTLQLLPKRPCPLKANAFPTKVKLMTNHYYFSLKKSTDLYQFSIDTQPPINDDSIEVLRKLVSSLRETLTNQIGFVCHKGKSIWGIKPLQKPLILNRKIKENTIQVIIKQTRVFNQSDIAKLQGMALKRVLQVYSVALKEKLVKMGLKEITKGRYFRIATSKNEEMEFDEIGLKALRTFNLRLVPLMHGISLQVDVGTRVLRTENFLQTLNSCSSMSEKRLFIGQSVQCNYGNRNSYKIVDIDFSKSPMNTFNQEKVQNQITYLNYYSQQYKIKIRQTKQPLIKVVLHVDHVMKQGKLQKKPIQGYLIPQLVRLVGIPQDCIKNQLIMRKLAQFTKLNPSQRCLLSQNIVDQLNKQKGYMSIQNPIYAEGYILPNPTISTYSSQRFAQNGNIIIKDKLKEPMKLTKESWLFVFSAISNDARDDIDDAEDIVRGFKQAQSMYGINIQDPKFAKVYKDNVQQWKREITKNFNNNLIVVLFFTNRESRYYGELKKYLINEIKVPSQAVLRKQLKNKGAMSIFSKIICQMNAKIGKSLWAVTPKHPFWKQKSLIVGGLSISKGKNGHTLAFVGTYSRDLTKTYGNSITKLPSRENISEKVYQDLLADWIKKYQEYEKVMPSIIILYREGLSDQQVKIQGEKEIQAINRVIARANKKFTDYNPQVIYTVVNKRVNSRFYSTDNKNERTGKFKPQINNPYPGTVVFEPLSSENAYDFHLAAQKVTQGTCTATHYRISYDSSKIPQEAIAQLTYEQCFNYYNWFGAVRVPSCLQNADKLSKLVGEHIKENIVSSNLLKTPFYL